MRHNRVESSHSWNPFSQKEILHFLEVKDSTDVDVKIP
jgi:hypothetical protein